MAKKSSNTSRNWLIALGILSVVYLVFRILKKTTNEQSKHTKSKITEAVIQKGGRTRKTYSSKEEKVQDLKKSGIKAKVRKDGTIEKITARPSRGTANPGLKKSRIQSAKRQELTDLQKSINKEARTTSKPLLKYISFGPGKTGGLKDLLKFRTQKNTTATGGGAKTKKRKKVKRKRG